MSHVNPLTIRLSLKERRLLKKVTKNKKTSDAIRCLLYNEVERQNQIALGNNIHGKLKLTDFDARLI